MINLKYKYRMYPTPAQEQKLLGILGSCRFIWNHFLAGEQARYQIDQKFNFFNSNSAQLTKLKQELDWLRQSPATALQQTLRNLDAALKQSFKRNTNRRGFPNWKTKRNWSGGFPLAMIGKNAGQESGKFKIPNVGLVKTKYHRPIPSEFSTANVKYEAGQWYLVLTVKVKKHKKSSGSNSVGIDLNSLSYVTSDAEVIDIPRFLGESQAQIARLQRSLSRKTNGSVNRARAQLQLARAHIRIKRRRLDYFHKLAMMFVKTYDVICLEDLNVKGIQQFNGHIVKDNAMAGFRNMLEYKAELLGKEVVIVDRWYPSTKTCSCCGHVQDMKLSDRTYKCHNCGVELDRDFNSALNIHRAGTARIYACGDQSSTSAPVVDATQIVEAGSYVL